MFADVGQYPPEDRDRLLVLCIAVLVGFVAALGLGVLLTGCYEPLPLHPQSKPSHDCVAAGARLEALGCRWARSDLGEPFASVCTRRTAYGDPIPATCISTARTCVEAEECQ